jgi:hypothetical protein
MTAEHTRIQVHTASLQLLPLQVPQPRRDHPGVIVKGMTARGMAIAAAVRDFRRTFLGIFAFSDLQACIFFLAFSSLLYPRLIWTWNKNCLGLPAHTWNQTIM